MDLEQLGWQHEIEGKRAAQAHGRTHDDYAPGRDQIRFDGVSFAYPSRPLEPVLRELTLSIPPGKTTAIVGASGSGKSTVAVLLQRLGCMQELCY